MGDAIKVDGLAQFVRGLRRLDAEVPKALRVGFNAAAQLVVDRARAQVPRRSGRAAASITVRSTRTAVRVTAGGKRAPYMPWLDFGGRVGRGRSVRRPFIGDGRYLYPAFYAERDRVRAATVDALLDAARAAGVEVD